MPRKEDSRPREVFLSHSSRNAAFVRRLARMLSAHGVNFFLSKRHIRGAQEWRDAIGEALKRCDWFLVVLSPQSVRSKWVKHELLYALQWVDFRGNFEEASRALLKVWGLPYR
jgi:hypothetical protein